MKIQCREAESKPLDKSSILSTMEYMCTLFDIPRHHIHISHGAAAVLQGIREETDDIDVAILSPKTWSNLLDYGVGDLKRYEVLGLNVAADVLGFQSVEFHWPDEIDICQDVETMNDFLVSTKYQILVERIKLGREKDREEAVALYSRYVHKLPDILVDRYRRLGWNL